MSELALFIVGLLIVAATLLGLIYWAFVPCFKEMWLCDQEMKLCEEERARCRKAMEEHDEWMRRNGYRK